MSTRRWLPAALTLAAVAVVALGVVGLVAPGEDPLEAARRRVPLGTDEEAVAQAVGRPADGRVAWRARRPRSRGSPCSGSGGTTS
jgi:hypothetical protein